MLVIELIRKLLCKWFNICCDKQINKNFLVDDKGDMLLDDDGSPLL